MVFNIKPLLTRSDGFKHLCRTLKQQFVDYKLLNQFRLIAVLEGISYLLFGITVPLKYWMEIPEPNLFVGYAHGLLFILYCVLGLTTAITYKWKFGFSTIAFLASLVPFGTFYLDTKFLKPKRFTLRPRQT